MSLPFLPLTIGAPNELDAALRASYGVDEGFVLMLMGGSPETDARYRSRFSACKVFTAGDHPGADVRGNWDEDAYWDEVAARAPTAIVIDIGSDSWIQAPAARKLGEYLRRTNAILMFSPPVGYTDWITTMLAVDYLSEPDLQLRFQVTPLEDGYVLYTYWNKLEESQHFMSEIESRVRDCRWLMLDRGLHRYHPWQRPGDPEYEAREAERVRERKECVAELSVLGPPMTFDDAVEQQVRLFSACAD